MREYKRMVKDWVYSAESNTPRWFVVFTVCMIGVMVVAPYATVSMAQQDNVIEDFEDGNDDGWESDPTYSIDNRSELAYSGQYSYRFEGQGSWDAARLSNDYGQPDSSSIRIRFDQLPTDTEGDSAWTRITFRGTLVGGGTGGGWGVFEIRDNGSVYRAIDGDRSGRTDTGVDLEQGRYYTLTVKNINYTANTADYAIDGETIATGVQTELNMDGLGGIELLGDESVFNADYFTKDLASSYEVSGEVIDGDNEPVRNANVSISTSPETTVQTGPNGRYSVYVPNGTYSMTASKTGYFEDRANVTVDGQAVSQNFRIRNLSKALTIQTRDFLKHGQTAEYKIFFATEETNRTEVTDEASISSGDTDVITINRANQQIVATSNESINNRTFVKATYTDENGTAYATEYNVTVANSSVENLAILPTMWRVNATFGSSTIQAILIALFAGVFGARISTSFGGLAMMQLAMIAGWFTGYATVGITMISLFAALFIGLNMAANIDYTVRQ